MHVYYNLVLLSNKP